ncbi:MAG: hypothetical protein EBT19_04485 [Methylocystaceae bacterium]|nr:hypothetical protein [Methylocystaceae bacterium]NBV94652.1 hypothetical protein [Methylocystaceae bacterium]
MLLNHQIETRGAEQPLMGHKKKAPPFAGRQTGIGFYAAWLRRSNLSPDRLSETPKISAWRTDRPSVWGR